MNADTPSRRPLHEEDLQAYVDGRLDEARRREVQDYLDRNEAAAAEVAAQGRQRQALRAAFAPVADEPIPARLNLARLVAEHQERARPAANAPAWRLVAAVLLAVGLGAAGGWTARGATPVAAAGGIASLAREAATSYAVYASDPAHPVELGADRKAELVDWVSARLQRPVAVPDLDASGYRFAGGRLVATEHGPAGLFVYEGAHGDRLALLVRPMAVERDVPTMRPTQGAVAGYSWSQRGLGFSVVGSHDLDALHPVADEVRRQEAARL